MQRKQQPPGSQFWQFVALEARFLSFVEVVGDCWQWRGHRTRKGYGQFGGKGRGDVHYAHRWAYLFYRGPIPAGLWVCHRCDQPGCVNPAHLFLGSSTDNNRDMRDKGRGTIPPAMIGAAHPLAVLTEEQVRAIRSRYQFRKVTLKDLGEEYGVSWGHISCIIRRKCWTHI